MPIRHSSKTAAIVALLACAWFAGCGTHRVAIRENSGFLGDYSQLKEGGPGEAAQVYVNDAVDFSRYSKIIIEPIEIIGPKKTELSHLDAADREHIEETLGGAIRQQLGADYQIVQSPGPGTMRLRVAVTEVRPAHPIRNLVSSILPIGLAVSYAKRVTIGTHVGVGRAAVEAEITDSVSGRRLCAAVDRRSGRKWGAGNFSSWGDVDSAFEHWAEKLRLRLEQLRSKSTSNTKNVLYLRVKKETRP